MIFFKRRSLLFLAAILSLTGIGLLAFYPSQSGSLHFPRFQHIAILLNDGRVLVAGGRVSGRGYISPEYFRYLTNFSWIPSSLFYSDDRKLKSCELFNPATGTWRGTGDLIFENPSAGLLLNTGKAFVAAYGARLHPQIYPEIYDPTIGKWEHAPDPITLDNLMRLPGAKRLLENGIDSFTATVVDLDTGNWARLDTGKEEPPDSLFIELPDNKILWAHGDECAVFNLFSLRWTSVEAPTDIGTMVLLDTGDILNTGGLNENGCKLFNYQLGQWRITGQPLGNTLDHELLPLMDGKILMCGGRGGRYAQNILNDSEIFDSKTESWHHTGALNQARFAFTATRLKDGRVLVAGGLGGNMVLGDYELGTCELYDPSTGKWTLLR